mmetsp:Transcript_14310/g.33646  ORF Transcript_14310/g.33646 Transcript_14310/m.33646 type:complete len:256 (-) Transcript_14310:62-829(-)
MPSTGASRARTPGAEAKRSNAGSGQARRSGEKGRTVVVSGAEMKVALKMLEDERKQRAKSEQADRSAAQLLQDQEQRAVEEAKAREEADAVFARQLQAEEQQLVDTITQDSGLAAALQREHGKSGKLLSRAWELDAFLQAPLGTRPTPRDGDLHPETLRRLAVMSDETLRHLHQPRPESRQPLAEELSLSRRSSTALSGSSSKPPQPQQQHSQERVEKSPRSHWLQKQPEGKGTPGPERRSWSLRMTGSSITVGV